MMDTVKKNITSFHVLPNHDIIVAIKVIDGILPKFM